jgi:hypothetical protein
LGFQPVTLIGGRGFFGSRIHFAAKDFQRTVSSLQ